jgi:short-subunit dehydrogenase
MAKGVLPVMRQQKSGGIINIGSLGGIVPVPFIGYYSISKFALEAFAEALRQEVRSLDIWVSIVEPAFFKTNIYAASKNTSNKISDYDGMGCVKESTPISGKGTRRATTPLTSQRLFSKS